MASRKNVRIFKKKGKACLVDNRAKVANNWRLLLGGVFEPGDVGVVRRFTGERRLPHKEPERDFLGEKNEEDSMGVGVLDGKRVESAFKF